MKRIGLISDTHGYLDDNILKHLRECEEIWHAGDIGEITVLDQLNKMTLTRAVYGNIDNQEVRSSCPLNQVFHCEEVKVWMTHIGGYPPKYSRNVKLGLSEYQPDLFICGHSHILKVMHDQERNILHLNPGAVGKSGFHKVRTMIRLTIDKAAIKDLQIIELQPRY